MSQVLTSTRIGLFWFLCLVVGLSSVRFVVPEIMRAAEHLTYHLQSHATVLYGHIGFSSVALIAMPIQFSTRLRMSRPRLHRYTGRIYVTCCLAGGACSLWLALTTTAGAAPAFGFGISAVLWIWATTQGFVKARAGDIAQHRRWMLRSCAMTFSAVTLRLYIGVGIASGTEFDVFYPIIAWASWVPNLIFVEWVLLNRQPIKT